MRQIWCFGWSQPVDVINNLNYYLHKLLLLYKRFNICFFHRHKTKFLWDLNRFDIFLLYFAVSSRDCHYIVFYTSYMHAHHENFTQISNRIRPFLSSRSILSSRSCFTFSSSSYSSSQPRIDSHTWFSQTFTKSVTTWCSSHLKKTILMWMFTCSHEYFEFCLNFG